MNIDQARFNMIEQQIRPTNIHMQDVLALLSTVKRENYFPDDQKSMAFFDTQLPLPGNGFALTPIIEAHIVQEVAVKKTESALVVGAGNGYLAALLAQQARHVTVQEVNPELKALAQTNLEKNGVTNVDVQLQDTLKGTNTGTFDVIVVTGSLESLPDTLQNELSIGGRLFVILGKEPVMTAQVITRESELFFNTKQVFETSVKRLSQAVAESTFTF